MPLLQHLFIPSLLALLLNLSIPVQAQTTGSFSFSPRATTAYQQAISLQFPAARQSLRLLQKEEPNNLIYHLIENYIDFFTVFIDEDFQAFQRLEKNKNQRLQLIRQGDEFSPYYYYCQAEIKLQWALVRLKFEQYFTAFNEVKSAYRLLNKNQEQFPRFIANKKSLGILHAMVGTVPDSYKWWVKLLGGMDGTIDQGCKEIAEVLAFAKKNDFVFEQETLVMYAFLLLHLNNQSEEAWAIIRSPQLNAKTNPLAAFVLANVAMRTGRNDEAVGLLQQRPRGSQFHPFPYLDYMLGLAKLYRLDPDADQYLESYLAEFNGRNYIKEAYQKLAWSHLIQGDENQYRHYIGQCKVKGYSLVEGDKTAQKEAKSGQLPHTELLRARLLFDGGYYQRAYDLLNTKATSDYLEQRHQLEHTYRLGRISHRLQRLSEAIAHYQATLDAGSSSSYYYACNAALQIGRIYESQGNYAQARTYFQTCLRLKPEEYKNGLHQQAKAGLNRLKGKA